MKLQLAKPYNKIIFDFAKYFNEAGFSLYLVGGACRDILLNKETTDFDFTTDAKPSDVIKIFEKTKATVIKTGIEHGTVTVRFFGNNFEVTTFRCDGKYSDNRHPESVSFNATLEEDLERRDFTINAFAAKIDSSLQSNCLEVIDCFDGISDLQNKKLRAIGNPLERFSEDALRVLRLFRFMAVLDFDIEAQTLNAAKVKAPNLSSISKERVRVELEKILLSSSPLKTFALMQECGILKIILPSLDKCFGVKQNHHHSYDVFFHILWTLNFACEITSQKLTTAKSLNSNDPNRQKLIQEVLLVRLSSLLHDIGKPQTQELKKGSTLGSEEYSFHCHEVVSGKMALSILSDLKFSNYIIKTVSLLVSSHMIFGCQNWKESTVKKFIAKIGYENIELLFELVKADRLAHLANSKNSTDDLDYLKNKIEQIKNANEAISLKDLAISGNDLIQLGFKAGKQIGITLDKLLNIVLDDNKKNSKEELTKIALEILKEKN